MDFEAQEGKNLQRARRRRISALLAFAALAALSGCDASLGVVQGVGLTNTNGSFTGINGATVLSPTSVKVSWNTASQYNTYQVFSSSSTLPIGNTIFSSYTITGLTPDTDFSFSVGGQSKSSSSVDGVSTSLTVHTWPQFKGVSTVVATSPTSLQANWTYKDIAGNPVAGPTFNVYVTAGTGAMNYNTPATSTTSNVVGITQLADGTSIAPNSTYSVVVRATYLDNTSEFNGNVLLVTTPSNISPLPTISADKVILGKWPSINVSGGLSGYVTSFRTATQTLGSILGNGIFKTPTAYPLSPGPNAISPTLTYNGTAVNLPTLNVVSRSLNETEIPFPSFFAVSGPSGTSTPRGAQRLGYVMAVGDFNCDGYADLAVAAPWGNFKPLQAQGTQDGGVYVFYGGPQGLITSPAPSANPTAPGNPLLLTRPYLGTGYGALNFGTALAAGNLNADTNSATGKGCDDLAVGTGTSGTPTGVGEVWVFFGSPNGLQTGSAVQNNTACNGSSCSPLVIYPANGTFSRNPLFGQSLAIGHLHTPVAGDTYQDLVIGGPYEVGTGGNSGSVWIYYGGSQGINFINPPTATPPYTKIIAPTMPGSGLGLQYPYNFGDAVAAVDLDHDGIDDLVVGAPADNTNNNCYASGEVYYYSSRSNGGGFSASSTVTQKLTNPMYGTTSGTCYSYNKFGGALANAGDINGDGYPDLIVGENMDLAGWAWGYAAFGPSVYYGSNSGPQTGNGCITTGDSAYQGSCAIHGTTACTVVGGGNPATCKIEHLAFNNTNSGNYWYGNLYGISVAGANAKGGQDINKDGYADVVFGWPLDYANTSVAMVYYGSSAGLQPSPSKVKPLVTGQFDNLGWAVALGDFNNDGKSDLAVSAPDNMTLNGAYGGVVFEFNGQSGGLPSNLSSYTQMITANVSLEGYSNSWAAAAGDINGDGYTDAFVVYPRRSVNRPANSYAYYAQDDVIVYYGSPNGLITSPLPSLSPIHATDPLLVPAAPGAPWSSYAYVAAAGDTNGDGYADLVMSDGTNVYVYFGSTSGLQVSAAPAAPPVTGLNPLIVASVTYATYIDPITWSYPSAAISAGDFNGDGYSDIALASYPALGQGRVLVIYGSATGPQTDGTLAHTITGGTSVALTNPCTGTVPNLTCKAQLLLGLGEPNWAASVAALGDVNNDGYGDLLVGSPYNSIVGTYNGAAYLFYGSPKGLQMWQSTASGFVIVPPALLGGETYRYAGTPVAPAGDVNGDGYADFILSANHSYESFGAGGGAYLFYGCGNGMNNSAVSPGCPASGIQGVPTSAAPPLPSSVAVNATSCNGSGTCQPLFFYPNPSSVASITGAWPGYYWGTTVGGVGDVNADGFADVVIGAFDSLAYCTTSNCPNYYVSNGAAVLFTGSSSGLTVNQNVTRVPACSGGVCSPYWVTPSMTNYGINSAAYYYFTWYTSFNNPRPADFNGDGYPDFVISSPHYMDAAGVSAFQGGMYIFQ